MQTLVVEGIFPRTSLSWPGKQAQGYFRISESWGLCPSPAPGGRCLCPFSARSPHWAWPSVAPRWRPPAVSRQFRPRVGGQAAGSTWASGGALSAQEGPLAALWWGQFSAGGGEGQKEDLPSEALASRMVSHSGPGWH